MYDVVAIVSGGLDSTTLMYRLKKLGHRVLALSFDYGQRHKKELDFASRSAAKLGFSHHIVDLSSITALISNSALTSRAEVPEGHYAEDNMKQTVVPNRNMIMLSIAAGAAVNFGAKYIATGVHAGDHFVYPDCRPEFIETAARAIFWGNQGFGEFNQFRTNELDPVYAPYINSSKTDIAYDALKLGVPLEETWSCYKGGEVHCGKCGTCVERLEAIHDALERFPLDERELLVDRTVYADNIYWRGAIGK